MAPSWSYYITNTPESQCLEQILDIIGQLIPHNKQDRMERLTSSGGLAFIGVNVSMKEASPSSTTLTSWKVQWKILWKNPSLPGRTWNSNELCRADRVACLLHSTLNLTRFQFLFGKRLLKLQYELSSLKLSISLTVCGLTSLSKISSHCHAVCAKVIAHQLPHDFVKTNLMHQNNQLTLKLHRKWLLLWWNLEHVSILDGSLDQQTPLLIA